MAKSIRYKESKDYKEPAFFVAQVDICFNLAAKRTVVKSELTLKRNPNTDLDSNLELDGRGFELLSLSLDGELLSADRYTYQDELLTVPGVGEGCVLESACVLHPESNRSQMGLFEADNCLITQMEADGFRRVTFFPDRPDVLAPYRVRLEADRTDYPVLLSNGDCIESGDLDDGRHYVIWEDIHPKPCYIFAIVAGDLGVLRAPFTTSGGRKVELSIYANPKNIGDCDFAMGALKRALTWDETQYGLEYDLSHYSIVALNGYVGAMENKGLNIFDAKMILADPRYSTDNDYLVLERILAHEVFHNWTGNRVTCRDWFELSLKEGLTRFRDRQFSEAMSAPGPKRIDAVGALRRNQFSEDDGSGCHPVKPERYADVQNLYTATIYEKGAELIRMLYILLGDELFHRGVRLYLQRNDGLAVTTEEFMGAMEEVSDRDLSQFRLWYHQKGRPRITVEGQYFGETESYKLKIGQSLPGALPMLIPITMSLFDSEGVLIPLKLKGGLADETVLELTEATQTFVFEGVHQRPIPSLFRGFSAPVSAEVETSDNDLSVLMAFDSDPYSKWDASQQLTTRIIRRLAAGQDDQSAGVETYIQAFGKTLNDSSLDPALLARVLTVADEPALSDGLTIIDVDGHVAGRSHLRSLLVEQYREKLLASYHMLASTDAYVPEPDAIARRAHRNLCLELLMENPLDSIRLLCLEQLQQSDNMNDAFVALACLCNVDCPEREEALEFSLQRWKKYPIAMSQWFTAQGLSKAHDTVDRVIELTRHAEFNLDNPNLTMALYGSIFRQNRVAFHDISGKGYEFLADTLIMGDKLRPSGSRWLMPQINQWRRFDETRQKLMKSALERVGAEPDLSPGLAENISNALG